VQLRLEEILDEIPEPPLAMEDYLEERFADVRADMRLRTTDALSQVQLEDFDSSVDSSPRPSQGARRLRARSRISVAVIASAVLAVGVGVGFLAARTTPVKGTSFTTAVTPTASPPEGLGNRVERGAKTAQLEVAPEAAEDLLADSDSPTEPATELAKTAPEPMAVQDAGMEAPRVKRVRAGRRRVGRRSGSRMAPTKAEAQPTAEERPQGWWGWESRKAPSN
jgi:hypothetical protein